VSVRRGLLISGALVVTAGVTWLLFLGLPRWYSRRATRVPAAPVATEQAATGRKIKARLMYVADEGTRLTTVERDVAFGETTSDQARSIVEAQIAPAAEPFASAVPPGTKLRALFVTERGEAFVDLTHEVSKNHPGGSTSEALTVYTFVDVLTVNLPAVTSVQLLVDGKPVDTLAGHIDLRRPLGKDLAWVQ
jgi:spore germination protein GerM